jgi:hypothetical protein
LSNTTTTRQPLLPAKIMPRMPACWTLAEAAGHASPYRIQHLLSRARVGDAATSTAPSKPTGDGTPTPTRRHGNDLQLPYQREPRRQDSR